MEREELFTIVLSRESAVNVVVGAQAVAQIRIIDRQGIGGVPGPFSDIPKVHLRVYAKLVVNTVVFFLLQVVSLLDYDHAHIAEETPSPGYPLVCLTVSTVSVVLLLLVLDVITMSLAL